MQTEIDPAIQSLEEEINYHLSMADGLKNAVEILKKKRNGSAHTHSAASDYDSDASNKGKIMYFLKRMQRFLHIRELAELAHEMEPRVSVEDFQKRFSPALSILKKEESVINIKIGKSLMNTFWGSSKWLNSEGTAKPEHEVNRKYVTEGAKDEYEL